MKAKLVAMVAMILAGCGLETMGQGSDSDDFAEPDIGPDEVESDVPEVDREDVAEDETSEPDEATPDETDEDVTDVPEDAEPEDAAETEAEDEDGDAEDGDTEDGEVDPCALPEIPTTGIFVFYCFDYDLLSPMHLWLQIERSGIPVVIWSEAPGCSTARSRRLECTLTLVWDALYKFNIELDPGVGIGWSCGPELIEVWGHPRVWLNGRELVVTPMTNGSDGCNHSFLTPTL